MRWLVEVSALGKTDQQKFCVEAESWQRALQAARAERGEDGPMSGFSIELLEEGYRAVDPLARVRFVVKRAPDDMPVTPSSKAKDGGAKPAAKGVPPTPPSSAEPPTQKQIPPTPSSASAAAKKQNDVAAKAKPAEASSDAKATAQVPPAQKKGQTMTFGSEGASTEKAVTAERAAPPPIGSSIPGLPPVKLVASREQDPNDSSPLTYREYAFAVAEGTSEEVAADVLRAQLRLVEAHIATAKMGKLVNLAVFDVEFTGKPPRPPVATLTWKDWKGDPVVAFPKQGGASSKPPRPPSKAPPSLVAGAAQAPVAIPQAAPAPQIAQPAPGQAPPQPQPQMRPSAPPPPQVAPSQPPPAPQPAHVLQQLPAQPGPAPAAQAQAPVQVVQVQPPPAPAPVQNAPSPQPQPQKRPSAPGFPSAPPPAPVVTEMAAQKRPSQPPMAAAPGMVKTPSGRFVRGRITGDELITSLFESMHDLHFLRDALDGGQFCLALATEVLPARAALIHFFDIDKREWVVACARGKDTQRLLTTRTAENDEVLLAAARKRRAVVVPNASSTQAERYRQLGGARSLIVAPMMQAGRALGALEIVNPLDGMPFNDDEGNAMTYIAEQYAEYLGSRGIVLDAQRITSAAQAAAAGH
jgi:hypothetical protein